MASPGGRSHPFDRTATLTSGSGESACNEYQQWGSGTTGRLRSGHAPWRYERAGKRGGRARGGARRATHAGRARPERSRLLGGSGCRRTERPGSSRAGPDVGQPGTDCTAGVASAGIGSTRRRRACAVAAAPRPRALLGRERSSRSPPAAVLATSTGTCWRRCHLRDRATQPPERGPVSRCAQRFRRREIAPSLAGTHACRDVRHRRRKAARRGLRPPDAQSVSGARTRRAHPRCPAR